jgi:hypothetical protein
MIPQKQVEPFEQHNNDSSNGKTGSHSFSILQFVLSVIAIGVLWGFAILSFVIGLSATAIPLTKLDNSTSAFMLSAVMIACGFLVLPSAFFSLRRILGLPSKRYFTSITRLNPNVLILFYLLILFTGYWINKHTELSLFLLPLLYVLAVLIPVLWLLRVLLNHLPLGSPQRAWGILDSGFILSPFIILFLELFAGIVFMIIGLSFIFNQPDLLGEIQSLTEALSSVNPPSPETIIYLLTPYLTSPFIIFLTFAYIALAVPLIEEAFKPLGVWLLIGRKLTPAEGYVAGVLCGAGFALFENLLMSANGIDWTFAVVARVGAAIVHMFTAGIMGWAITYTWKTKHYAKLGLTYLGVVIVHGLWNAMSLLIAYGSLSQYLNQPIQKSPLLYAISVAPFILTLITIAMFMIMLRINHSLRNSSSDGLFPNLIQSENPPA